MRLHAELAQVIPFDRIKQQCRRPAASADCGKILPQLRVKILLRPQSFPDDVTFASQLPNIRMEAAYDKS
jgi:hypothetical protein